MNHIMRKSWRIAIYRDGEKERQVKSNMNLNTRNVKLHKNKYPCPKRAWIAKGKNSSCVRICPIFCIFFEWSDIGKKKRKNRERKNKGVLFLFACSSNTRHTKNLVLENLKWTSLTVMETNLIYYCKCHFILCVGFAWLGFGSMGAAEVASVRRY